MAPGSGLNLTQASVHTRLPDYLAEAGHGFGILTVGESGAGSVETWQGEVVPDGVPAVRLGVADLSAVYLGSVSLTALAAAGRVQSTDAAAAARIFSWFEPARLSFWY